MAYLKIIPKSDGGLLNYLMSYHNEFQSSVYHTLREGRRTLHGGGVDRHRLSARLHGVDTGCVYVTGSQMVRYRRK